MKTYYETLEIDKTATPEEIKKAHKKKAKENHPDSKGNAEEFIAIQQAYEVLINEDKRKRYDNNEPEPLTIEQEAVNFILTIVESVIVNIE